MTDPRIPAAIVLAGGRSSRFGRDKLAEPVDGRSLLLHAIDAVRPLAREIVVVAAPAATPAIPPDVRLVHDDVAFEGPLAGVRVGLEAVGGSVVLVVGGDMPSLVGAVLDSMAVALAASGEVDVVVLEHDGRPRPLPMLVRREPALEASGGLLEAGERRLRALTDRLATLVIPETTWRALDPDGDTVRDVDLPSDLP